MRLLAALAEAEGGQLIVYVGDMDAMPEGAHPGIQRETVVTPSRPEGYEIIVISYPPEEAQEASDARTLPARNDR